MPEIKLSLREKKYATQKLKILDTFDEKLKQKSLNDISVKEIANELDISEMTFFNYFGSKKEVLIYFIELWSLQMQIHIEGKRAKEAIYTIFKETAKTIENNPNLFMEIVSTMALQGMSKKDISIGKAERIIYFGEDIRYKEGGFRELIMPLIEDIVDGEHQTFVYISLYNTCFSTPLLMKCKGFGSLKEQYFKQIDYILKGYDNG